jgi:hypothetical protein
MVYNHSIITGTISHIYTNPKYFETILQIIELSLPIGIITVL